MAGLRGRGFWAQRTAARLLLVVVEKKLSLPESLRKTCKSTPAQVRFSVKRGKVQDDDEGKERGRIQLFRFGVTFAVEDIGCLRARKGMANRYIEQSYVWALCWEIQMHTRGRGHDRSGIWHVRKPIGWCVQIE